MELCQTAGKEMPPTNRGCSEQALPQGMLLAAKRFHLSVRRRLT